MRVQAGVGLAERRLKEPGDATPPHRRLGPGVGYVDPLTVAEGREVIDATIAAVQSQFPGMRFRLAGAVDGHHDQARSTWELGPADAEALVMRKAPVHTEVLSYVERIQTTPSAAGSSSTAEPSTSWRAG